ncbi:hypothetical protein [Sphingobium bisphenolivorans]|uniref:hypothetical protein n=1 Tax=Sphingobium bisphenolivorans TaxID=1335760 RepID=UPI00126A42CC|nr:hypothetical protein [Sphingobium bisphenolivorans]
MSRYYVQPRAHRPRSMDWEPIGNAWLVPMVADHEATDTGLVDQNGDPIMRAPNEMGFVWSEGA